MLVVRLVEEAGGDDDQIQPQIGHHDPDRDPDAADWLMYSRTYDAQRYSPLSQINRDNVAQLEEAL